MCRTRSPGLTWRMRPASTCPDMPGITESASKSSSPGKDASDSASSQVLASSVAYPLRRNIRDVTSSTARSSSTTRTVSP